jgi:5-methylcytosine-specific restriction protein B
MIIPFQFGKKQIRAELNYFIGTEKSRYFSTTFWYVPVAYPGSSSDLINLVFTITRNKKIEFHLQFNQTKNPHDDQNLCFRIYPGIKPLFKEVFQKGLYAPDTNKMEFLQLIQNQYTVVFRSYKRTLKCF